MARKGDWSGQHPVCRTSARGRGYGDVVLGEPLRVCRSIRLTGPSQARGRGTSASALGKLAFRSISPSELKDVMALTPIASLNPHVP